MNRLLINMKNKVDVINGAIDQCYKLINNEEIKLNGLWKMTITKGKITDEDLLNRINELQKEKNNLLVRIDRMGG